MLENPRDWPAVLGPIQRNFNNTPNSTGKSPNEVCYGFTLFTNSNLHRIFKDIISAFVQTRLEIADSIAYSQIMAKHAYDKKHKPIQLKINDYALLRLHKGYDIPFIKVLGSKLSQQYAGPFKIIEKIGNLIYRLELPTH